MRKFLGFESSIQFDSHGTTASASISMSILGSINDLISIMEVAEGRSAKKFSVRPAELLPALDVGNKHSRANDVLQCGTGPRQCRLDFAQHVARLSGGIACANHIAMLIGGGGTGYRNVIADAHRARVANDGFPRCAG